MLGDRSWHEDLRYGYDQYVADSRSAGREAEPFESWAREKTWRQFVKFARYLEELQPFTAGGWANASVRYDEQGRSAPGSRVICRHEVSGQLMIQQMLEDLKAYSGTGSATELPRLRAYTVVCLHIRQASRGGDQQALAIGKQFVYDWLVRAATRGTPQEVRR